MAAKVTLIVSAGHRAGKAFVFDEHDTFLFGRMPDCHACLPDDNRVSRHHFMLEVNPPEACLRDLGSLNGTFVNGVKHGGRHKGETPEAGAHRKFPEVELKDGDEIRVGETVLKVRLEAAAVCCEGHWGQTITFPETKPWCHYTTMKPRTLERLLQKPQPRSHAFMSF